MSDMNINYMNNSLFKGIVNSSKIDKFSLHYTIYKIKFVEII